MTHAYPDDLSRKDALILKSLSYSGLITKELNIHYKSDSIRSYQILDMKNKETPRRSLVFFDKISQLIRSFTHSHSQEMQVSFFEPIEKLRDKKWYYTIISVMGFNYRDLPEKLSTVSILLNKDSLYFHRALELDNFKILNQERFNQLTRREKEVVSQIALGMNNQQIAEKLFISRRTVEQHRKNVKRKLKPKSLVELIEYAQAYNLV